MTGFEWAEYLSYVVTVVGFPFAIGAFIFEKRRELQGDEEELHQRLSDEYVDFLKLVLENADLQLLRKQGGRQEQQTDDQNERKLVLFEILISLFERAYLLVYEENMRRQTKRLWSSWEDYMREWCRREDFLVMLPTLLEGEDEDFKVCILAIAEAETAKAKKIPIK